VYAKGIAEPQNLLDIIFDVTPIAHPHIFFLGQMMAIALIIGLQIQCIGFNYFKRGTASMLSPIGPSHGWISQKRLKLLELQYEISTMHSAVFSDLAAPPQDLSFSCGPLPSALHAFPSR